MAAANKLSTKYSERIVSNKQSLDSQLRLLGDSFSSRKINRQFPGLVALHRTIDGAVLGAVIGVITTASITLHAQYLWTASVSRLETTRGFNHRFLDSTASLESHFLKEASLSKFMRPTQTKDLIYLDAPSMRGSLPRDQSLIAEILYKIRYQPTTLGY